MVLDLNYSLVLNPWLHDLPHALAAAGLIDPAIDLGQRLTNALPGEGFEADVVRILVGAGRREEAIRSAVCLMEGHCTLPDRLAEAGEAMAALGETEKARLLYRQASSLEDDPRQRRAYLELEIPLLRELGLEEEAKAIGAILPALERDPFDGGGPPPDDSWAFDPGEPPRRPRPNDPCPCGSGKRFRKCCR
jgi:tetratricopeptide (TPR) repeat protein